MTKDAKKKPGDMTTEELRDRFFTLQRRIGRFNKSVGWVAGGIYAAAILLAAGAAIAGTGGAAMIFAVGCGIGSGYVGLGALLRDSKWEDEAFRLRHENNTRCRIAEAQAQRAKIAEANELSKQFAAAMEAVKEGRGIDRDLQVRKPLRLTSKSMFGIFAS